MKTPRNRRAADAPRAATARAADAARFALLPALPLAGLFVFAATAPPARTAPAKPAPGGPSFARDVRPVMEKYCVPCHTGKTPAADLDLSGDKAEAAVVKRRDVWEKVADNVAQMHMPPQGMPQPTHEQRDRLVAFVQSTLSKADCEIKDAGRVTMRRLNRTEYNNTVRDLLGTDLRLADEFPSDDVGYGFDNIGDVLTISPLLMEKYLGAAAKAARAAVRTPEESLTPQSWEGSRLVLAGGQDVPAGLGEGAALFSAGDIAVEYLAPAPGKYALKVRAWAQQAGDENARMALKLNNLPVKEFEVTGGRPNGARTFEVTLDVSYAGPQRIAASFLNDFYDEKLKNPPRGKGNDRNLIVQSIAVEPVGVTKDQIKSLPASPAQKRLFAPGDGIADENLRARKIVSAFATRAFRRPVRPAEADRLVALYKLARKNGESFERGIQLAVQATLVSPNFLFRVEADPAGAKPGSLRPLNDYELASRLSYFLWASMPDETLMRLAAQKKLSDPQVLVAQAKRMLKDPRSAALTDSFAGQWLQLKKLDRVAPDTGTFPAFDEGLRAAMRTETQMYFDAIMREDRSVLEFLDSDWTFLNGRLAKHYGNTQVTGDEFRRVKLVGGRRGGVLTQASVLTLTSNPTRTSPVKRGKWVLENFFNAPPPPPPPGVAQLPDDEKKPLTGTLRQRLEQHRADPGCASCHQRMDPIGFGLENFDAIGSWRQKDGESPIDAKGSLLGGTAFEGPKQLRAALLNHKPEFTRALTEKLLTYALGRGLENYDRCNVTTMAEGIAKKGYRFSAVVESIVTSDPFRRRRVGDRPPGGGAVPSKAAPPAQKPAQKRVAAHGEGPHRAS
jgi:hypothetical protein